MERSSATDLERHSPHPGTVAAMLARLVVKFLAFGLFLIRFGYLMIRFGGGTKDSCPSSTIWYLPCPVLIT
ncbi:hypothetical protein ASG59_18710 [Methylobacterium sp. Leaf466]|nr:hypothetical protein ASG59_18710 [Methylobacterium sp. Leaf466]